MPEICLRPAFHEGLCIPKTCEEKDPAKSVPERSVGQSVSAGGTEVGGDAFESSKTAVGSSERNKTNHHDKSPHHPHYR